MARPFTKEESDILKKQFLIELESNRTIAEACEKLGIVRSTVYYWRGTDSKFRDDFIMRDWEMVSKAENTLDRLMEKDDLGAACFILKTRGRQFGYMISDKDVKEEIVENKPTKTDQEIIADYLAKKNANNA